MNNLPYVKYIYLDYSSICKRGSYDRLNPEINKLSGLFDDFSCFNYSINSKTINST